MSEALSKGLARDVIAEEIAEHRKSHDSLYIWAQRELRPRSI